MAFQKILIAALASTAIAQNCAEGNIDDVALLQMEMKKSSAASRVTKAQRHQDRTTTTTTNFLGGLVNDVSSVVNTVSSAINVTINDTAIDDDVNGVVNTVDNVVNDTANDVSGVVNTVDSVVNETANDVSGVVNVVNSVINANATEIDDVLENVTEGLNGVLQNVTDDVAGLLANVLNDTLGDIYSIAHSLLEDAESVGESVRKAFVNFTVSADADVHHGLDSTALSVKTDAKDIVADIQTGLADVRKVWGNISNDLGSLKTVITNALGLQHGDLGKIINSTLDEVSNFAREGGKELTNLANTFYSLSTDTSVVVDTAVAAAVSAVEGFSSDVDSVSSSLLHGFDAFLDDAAKAFDVNPDIFAPSMHTAQEIVGLVKKAANELATSVKEASKVIETADAKAGSERSSLGTLLGACVATLTYSAYTL